MIELTEIQKLAIEKLERLKVGALFMKMGTGKTLTACHLIYNRLLLKKCNYVVWIAPNNTFKSTKPLIKEFSEDIFNKIRFENIEAISLSDAKFLRLLKDIEGKECFVVVDESLTIKNPHSKRTNRIINRIGQSTKYKLILNGTPISKNPMDLWAQMEFLSPKILNMSLRRFQCTFFIFKQSNINHLLKSVNIPYLMSLIEPYVFDADLFLNVKRNYHTISCDLSAEEETDYEEKKSEVIWEEFGAKGNASFFAMVTRMQRYYLENCKSLVENYKKFHQKVGKHIVFVRFLSDIDKIKTEKHLVICGEIPRKQREVILEEFEKSEKSLIITYGCGAFGLNMQFCNKIAFYSHQFDYALREQAEYRIYRLGQNLDCDYYDFHVNTGLELLIQLSLRKKKNTNYLLKKELENIKNGINGQFLKTMKIEKIKGDDEKIYQYIAPFAMDTKVLTEFYRYPILTGSDYLWFIVFSNKRPIAFSAIKIEKDKLFFTSDYVVPEKRNKGFHDAILKERIKWAKENNFKKIYADCTKKCVKNYLKNGFKINKEYKDWTNVTYEEVS